MKKVLGTWDLTAMGVASMVGAGIFSTIGMAAHAGGPGVILLFLFTGITCLFSALCYAELAAAHPETGSAYTYAFRRFGPLVGWIIGWDLFLEYAVGNMAVAISWSDYLSQFLSTIDIHIPAWLTMSYTEAKAEASQDAVLAWAQAPRFFGTKFIADIPAIGITFIITLLVWLGIRESNGVNLFLVAVKLSILLIIITLGWSFVQPTHWTPFLPNGWTGVFSGTAAVFFAYIGFDAITTLAGETKDASKQLPRAILYSLLIVTSLYVLLSVVLTGMVSYTELNVGDPLLFAIQKVGWVMMQPWVGISAILSMTGVLLVFQLGQPRIWMAMSKDGLLPSFLSSIHPKFHTPTWATWLTGFSITIPLLFLDLKEVVDLTSIGTLFAFLVVCAGVWWKPRMESSFKVPYINGRYWTALIILPTLLFYILTINPGALSFIGKGMTMICLLAIVMVVRFTFIKQLSLLPALGVCSNLFLLSTMSDVNWLRFIIWLALGGIIFYTYGKYRVSSDK
ncbi:MAG: amino acid permease [Cytophagaceae bacterium]